MIIDIQGFCPACGNKSLHIYSHDGFILCLHPGCPDPDTAGNILKDSSEIHHIVRFDAEGYYTVEHPLRERINSACTIHGVVMAWLGVPTMARKAEVANTVWRVRAGGRHTLWDFEECSK
jgi:hypothetical protein